MGNLAKKDDGILGSILNLEDVALKQEQLDVPVTHHFADGMYARVMYMPKGAIVTGKVHKSEHFCIIMEGMVDVVSEELTDCLAAPMLYTSYPGAKRALYAHEDTVWATVHRTEQKDIEALEADLVSDTVEGAVAAVAQHSHRSFMKALGITQAQADEISNNIEDRINIPLTRTRIAPSPIHGFGVFATCDINEGGVIEAALVKGKRTQVGRFMNHSPSPNGIIEGNRGESISVIAAEPIKTGDEITVDYNSVVLFQRGD